MTSGSQYPRKGTYGGISRAVFDKWNDRMVRTITKLDERHQRTVATLKGRIQALERGVESLVALTSGSGEEE